MKTFRLAAQHFFPVKNVPALILPVVWDSPLTRVGQGSCFGKPKASRILGCIAQKNRFHWPAGLGNAIARR